MTTRREFFTLLGGAVGAAWPVGAWGQQLGAPTVAYLMSDLKAMGHILRRPSAKVCEVGGLLRATMLTFNTDGQMVNSIDCRYGTGAYSYSRSLIAAVGGEPAVDGAKGATSTIRMCLR
jgi:hypothetical protein